MELLGSTFPAYCDGLIDVGLSRLPGDDTTPNKRSFQGSVKTHAALLDIGRQVIQKMAEDPRMQEVAIPTLYHPDLHARNIFVSDDDPTVVTGFIDWQSSSIEPAFEYADETPDFAAPASEFSEEDEDPKSNAVLCRTIFDACVHGLIPKLSAARRIDELLLQPFRFCHRTWKDGAVAFRHRLIGMSRYWKDLDLAGSCPYKLPTSDEIRVHEDEYESLVTARKVLGHSMNLLDVPSDGWVPRDLWEAKKEANREAFYTFLDMVKNAPSAGDRSMSQHEEDLRSIWPFDIE
ncbi:MAG: hypothetical protein LQ340_003107 [Diploschistes diacapsis]|nr:MAG: hypothetical protein LQ340_003107 [Diploschistes diacapsis]